MGGNRFLRALVHTGTQQAEPLVFLRGQAGRRAGASGVLWYCWASFCSSVRLRIHPWMDTCTSGVSLVCF